MTLTQQEIEEINQNCPSDQGIFFEPSMIPIHIKDLVIYSRYPTSEWSGGNYKGYSPELTRHEPPANRYEVLDMVLAKLKPDIKYFQFKEIEKLIRTNEEEEPEYYGNSTEWKIEYIILPELLEYLKTI